MAARSSKPRVRLVYRRSRLLTKCVVLAAVVFCMVALLTLRSAILDTQSQTNDLRAQAAAMEQENQQLEQNIDELGTVQGITRIAEEELGLVDPDTIVYKPE